MDTQNEPEVIKEEAVQPIVSVMDNLQFSTRKVVAIEQILKKTVALAISQADMQALTVFVEKGLDTNTNGAIDAIDAYISMGGDTFTLQLKIMEVLEKDGFLPRALKVTEKIQSKLTNLNQEEDDSLEIYG